MRGLRLFLNRAGVHPCSPHPFTLFQAQQTSVRALQQQAMPRGLHCSAPQAAAAAALLHKGTTAWPRASQAQAAWHAPLMHLSAAGAAAAVPSAALPALSTTRSYRYRSGRKAARAAAQGGDAATTDNVVDFSDDWVNCVGLTGVVVRGPILQHFATGSSKAVIVLALYNRKSGESNRDRPRPIMVEAWGDKAVALSRQVQPGASVYVLGHLALDLRPNQRTSGHGPALTVIADSWTPVAVESLSADRYAYEYKGEFDYVLGGPSYRSAAAAGAPPEGASAEPAGAEPAAARGTSSAAVRKQQHRGPPGWKVIAMGQAISGQPAAEIAAQLQVPVRDVIEALLAAAEAEGSSSRAWGWLLHAVGLSPQQQPDPVAMFEAVSSAMGMNLAPLTKAGEVRRRPIRDYLLSDSSGLSEVIKRQEEQAGGDAEPTYAQISVLMGLKKVGGHPAQHLV